MLFNCWIRAATLVIAVVGMTSCAHQPEEPSPAVHSRAVVTSRFGQRQLDQMLEDRPDMNEAVPQSHPVRRWLADGFAGERTGLRVHWCASVASNGWAAQSFKSRAPYPAIICVSAGTEVTALDKWAAVVYAMLDHEVDWDSVIAEAMKERLDYDGYAEKCTRVKFAVLQRTQEFLLEQPLPKSSHGRDQWYNWITTELGSYEEYKSASNCPKGMSYQEVCDNYRRRWIVPSK